MKVLSSNEVENVSGAAPPLVVVYEVLQAVGAVQTAYSIGQGINYLFSNGILTAPNGPSYLSGSGYSSSGITYYNGNDSGEASSLPQ